jgi:purine nucleosidase
MTARRIIIDTDPGLDDAVAILLALASPAELELLGLTCVAGNVPLELTARNARMVCELAGRPDIPVFAGCDRPLSRPPVTSEHVHGSSGLDGADLPAPSMRLQERHAVDFIVETLRAEPPGSVTLCPVGPLTNIAMALRKAPDIAGRAREIVLMGGACRTGGNVTPVAEFNIHVDPQAADIVFRAGVPLTVIPLDVTREARVTPARNAAFRALGTPVGRAVAGMTGCRDRPDTEKHDSGGAPLHDPCAIARLIRPELVSGRHVNVAIETVSELTMGMTVADWQGVSGRAPNALVAGAIDAGGFFDLLTERLARL